MASNELDGPPPESASSPVPVGATSGDVLLGAAAEVAASVDGGDVEQLRADLRRLQCELDEARSLVAVANYSLEESLETERRKCQDEVATLHQLMRESVEDAVRHTKETCDGEVRRLKNLVTRLELELHEVRTASDAKESNPNNVFSSVTKTLARKVGHLANPTQSSAPADDDLETSMKAAQEDVQVLRSLVQPLEEEIKALKTKLRTADDQLQVYESSQAELVRGTQLLVEMAQDQSLHSILHDLRAKNGVQVSVPHQEMYMAIVNLERTALHVEKERLKTQLQEACQLLEHERRQYRELRRSLSKAGEAQLSHSLSQDSSRPTSIKDKVNLGPLLSRISPVLKRRSPAHSPPRDAAHGADAADTTDPVAAGAATGEDATPNGRASAATGSVASYAEKEAEVQQLRSDRAALEKQLVKAREEVDRTSELVKDMEHKWTEVAKDYEKQVTALYTNNEELQGKLKAVRTAFDKFRGEAEATLRQLQFDRQSVSSELVRLQEENDFLVGKHSAHAEQLQNEIIDLPDSVVELHYVVLSLREDLIAAKVAKEAGEKKRQAELVYARDQLEGEKQAKEAMQNSLSGEIDYLREQLGLLRSVSTQLDEETKRRVALETALQKANQELTKAQSRAIEADQFRDKNESEFHSLKNRVASLQADLETSEAVQRDFVKLSQQLQVQLEKIRQSEKELRWQYEEDVDHCAECRQVFTVTKRKHHCRHCGQIFCFDCLRKTVSSGPNKRQSRVCDVCFFLLVQDSAPFFSSEPQPASN